MTEKHCSWCLIESLYLDYHDKEWGRPCYDPQQLFEMLNLEGAQAGLSWITILRKRDGYRAAFKNFDPVKIARMRQSTVEKLLLNPDIVRHRLKIEGVITNARLYNDMHADGESFATFLWSFVDYRPRQSNHKTIKTVPAQTTQSQAMSKALKKRGFKFCGPTICYAFMQAAGMVNDHVQSCPQRVPCKKLAAPKYMPKGWPGLARTT